MAKEPGDSSTPRHSAIRALQATQANLGNGLQWLKDGTQHNASELQRHVGGAVQNLGRHIAVQQRQRQGPLSMLAVSLQLRLMHDTKAAFIIDLDLKGIY